MKKQNLSISPKAYMLDYAGRMGVIFSNLSILCLILAILSGLSIFLPVLYFLGLIIIIIITLGTIFIAKPNFFDLFINSGEIIENVVIFAEKAVPVLFVLSLATAIVSVAILPLDKNNRHVGRMVVTTIILVVTAIICGVTFFGGAQ